MFAGEAVIVHDGSCPPPRNPFASPARSGMNCPRELSGLPAEGLDGPLLAVESGGNVDVLHFGCVLSDSHGTSGVGGQSGFPGQPPTDGPLGHFDGSVEHPGVPASNNFFPSLNFLASSLSSRAFCSAFAAFASN